MLASYTCCIAAAMKVCIVPQALTVDSLYHTKIAAMLHHIPSSVLQVLVLPHRVFDYYTVYYIVVQIQLEAQMYDQHSPCKMAKKIYFR